MLLVPLQDTHLGFGVFRLFNFKQYWNCAGAKSMFSGIDGIPFPAYISGSNSADKQLYNCIRVVLWDIS